MKLPRDGTVERMYAEGMGCRNISKVFGCNDEAVRQYLRRRGIQLRPKAEGSRIAGLQRRRPVPTEEVARLYKDGATLNELRERFKVSTPAIVARLRAAGVERRRSFWGADMPYRCEDGHLVRSRYEQMIDDWLWRHHLAHAYEPLLAFTTNERQLPEHADFLVGDSYIEMWGVVGREDYTERRHRKLAGYAAAGLTVISLYPRDVMEQLDMCLAHLLTPATV